MAELEKDNAIIEISATSEVAETTSELQLPDYIPVIPLPGMVLLPHMMVAIRVAEERAVAAIQAAMSGAGFVVVAPSPDPIDDNADTLSKAVYDENGLPVVVGQIGVVARIDQKEGAGEGLQLALQGLHRILLDEIKIIDDVAMAKGQACLELTESAEPDPSVLDLMDKSFALLENMVGLMPGLPDGVMAYVRRIKHPGHLADQTGYFPDYTFDERVELLAELDPTKRLEQAMVYLKKHTVRLQLRADLMEEVKEEIDDNQREAFLREQLRVIRRELGEEDEPWLEELRRKLQEADLPDNVQTKAERELDRLTRMGPHAPEVSVLQNYLEWITDLPWNVETSDTVNLAEAAQILDADHYGLAKVKERIIEYLAVRSLAGEKLKAPIICFVGPPGVGKTSLGRSIARVLGRKFVRISLGGMHDEAEIRGHRRTYVGAMPGRIIQGMRDAGSRNPVFMLDEIDKIGRDFRGDPAAALLEALDAEQNSTFSDHYLEVPFNLSQTIFITTANLLDPIPPALRDRMEVIPIPGYTEEEKLAIARHFLVPKQVQAHGLQENELSLSEEALMRLIREYTREAGVRNLEREIAAVTRKVARNVVENTGTRKQKHSVRANDIERYLGPPHYEFGVREATDQVGVATGVAVTEAGGEVLPVEVSVIEGTGKLLLTGQLGEVMRESAQAALTYARSRLNDMGVSNMPLEKRDIHIHVPAGGVPKDGPSAGIAMATALLSALSGRAVKRDVAMTGEVTLRGRVLPIGGLKEKILAAKAAGITQFILPAQNRKDLPELSKSARRGISLIEVEHMDQVLGVALATGEEQTRHMQAQA